MDPLRERMRFGRERRLTRASEFTRVRAEGKTQRTALMTVGFLDVGDKSAFRAGFITTRRLGGAVMRNRIRRRLRDIVRRHQHEVRNGIWLVVIPRAAATRASYAELEAEWLRLVTRASILRPS